MGNKLPSGPVPRLQDQEARAKLLEMTQDFVAKLEEEKANHVARKIDLQAANTDAATVGSGYAALEAVPPQHPGSRRVGTVRLAPHRRQVAEQGPLVRKRGLLPARNALLRLPVQRCDLLT